MKDRQTVKRFLDYDQKFPSSSELRKKELFSFIQIVDT